MTLSEALKGAIKDAAKLPNLWPPVWQGLRHHLISQDFDEAAVDRNKDAIWSAFLWNSQAAYTNRMAQTTEGQKEGQGEAGTTIEFAPPSFAPGPGNSELEPHLTPSDRCKN